MHEAEERKLKAQSESKDWQTQQQVVQSPPNARLMTRKINLTSQDNFLVEQVSPSAKTILMGQPDCESCKQVIS
jgi:hypothetical protein